MMYADGAVEVEFADRDGRPHALVSMSRDKLLLLRAAPPPPLQSFLLVS
jgi:hypothetical protein